MVVLSLFTLLSVHPDDVISGVGGAVNDYLDVGLGVDPGLLSQTWKQSK